MAQCFGRRQVSHSNKNRNDIPPDDPTGRGAGRESGYTMTVAGRLRMQISPCDRGSQPHPRADLSEGSVAWHEVERKKPTAVRKRKTAR